MAVFKFYLDRIFKTPDSEAEKIGINELKKESKSTGKSYPKSILNPKETSIYLMVTIPRPKGSDKTNDQIKSKTEFKIRPLDWDFKEKRVKTSFDNGLNSELEELKKRVYNEYTSLKNNKSITLNDIEETIKALCRGRTFESDVSFYSAFKEYIEIHESERGRATIQKYWTLYNSLRLVKCTRNVMRLKLIWLWSRNLQILLRKIIIIR